MDKLKEKYIQLMEEKGLGCSHVPVIMELSEEDDKAIIEDHLREHFTHVGTSESLGIEEFVEIQRTAQGLEGHILIRGHDYSGKALYFEVTNMNPNTVQYALRRLDEFYIHVAGTNQQEIADQLRPFFTTDEAEIKPHENGYGNVYQEDDSYCVDALVNNKMGLHARPSMLLIQEAAKYISDIRITNGNQEVNGKSILNVMMLAAEKGTELTIKAKGEDAKQAVERLYETINGFNEED
jgi:phosphocarrier protein